MAWQLIVKTIHGEHVVFIRGNDPEAKAALVEVQDQIGAKGVVRIADRLALNAEDITAAQIVERHLEPRKRRGT
jgi:hypothetical protein